MNNYMYNSDNPHKEKIFSKYSMVNNNAPIELFRLPLNGTTFRIFHYLVFLMGYGNEIILNQTEVAQELGISRSKINASLKILIEHGLIRKLPKKLQGIRIYLINPTVVYKGKKEVFSECVNSFFEV